MNAESKPRKRRSLIILTAFMLFVAYKILTPTHEKLMRVEAPDGSKTARLQRVYYDHQPSYRIDYREPGKIVWLNLFDSPVQLSDSAEQPDAAITWSEDSTRIDFSINGTLVWQYFF
ncbi:MAG: hypothetical protein JXR40_08945 [Pontiellaceae bacterium]|nr:hypothetical protein [Pontiellaceae bacterium]